MLIGVTGCAGSGKDTFADHLCDWHGFKRYRFADPIKYMINAMLGVSTSSWNDREWKEGVIPWLGKSPRFMAQTLGTEWGRNIVNQNLWLLLAEQERIKHKNLIIPDVRFTNEASWIIENNGVVIKIIGSNGPQVDNAGHASEAGVSESYITHVEYNNGTIEDLHQRAEEQWQKLVKRL